MSRRAPLKSPPIFFSGGCSLKATIRLFIFYLIYRNRDSSEKIHSKNFLCNWISKYRHRIFMIPCYLEMESEDGFLQYAYDIEKVVGAYNGTEGDIESKF